ncbi:MAG: DsbA family protein [Chloroflexia bacterium]|nr:DsbA family protein [Chloroflexia bacterium]
MSQQKPRGRSVATPTTKMNLRTFYIAFGVIVLVGIAVVVYISLGGTKAATPSANGPTGTLPTARSGNIPTGKTDDGRYFVGNANAPVTVVEYADYQCPGCGFYATNLEAPFEKEYVETGKVRLIFHDFPLPMHANAVAAAVAARCAGAQSTTAYWQMHDMLYTNQRQWSGLATSEVNSQFATYANQLSLDVPTFAQCLNDSAVTDVVLANQKASNALGLPGTPSFAVNGVVVDASDAKTLQDIDAKVRAAIAAAANK